MKNKRRAQTTPKSKTEIGEVGARVEVRRHASARRLTLRVSRTRRAVIVTIPLQCNLEEAGSFLSRHIDWVRERLDNLPGLVPLADGAALPLRGEAHQVVFTRETSTRLVRVERNGVTRPHILVPGPVKAAPKRLRNWLQDEALKDLERAVTVHARKLQVRPKRIAVRDQASRWGSCSTTRVLSFSWRLILAPPAVLDYVAAHEVAHLREMNHGPGFWSLVKQALPDFEVQKTWLRIYGLDLHRYGSAPGPAA